MNKIYAIGLIGKYTCYLNIPKDEAIRRFCKREDINVEDFEDEIWEIHFNDEFFTYDIWEIQE